MKISFLRTSHWFSSTNCINSFKYHISLFCNSRESGYVPFVLDHLAELKYLKVNEEIAVLQLQNLTQSHKA